MRTVLSFVSGAVALLALLAAVPLLWLSTHIVDEDGYVEFSSTLAKDAELQRAFSAYLTDELSARGVIPAALKAPASTALSGAMAAYEQRGRVRRGVGRDERNSHREAFADPMPKVLGVDVSPMATFVAKQVTGDLPVALAVPSRLVVPVVTDASDREMVDRVEESTGSAGSRASSPSSRAVGVHGTGQAYVRRRGVARRWHARRRRAPVAVERSGDPDDPRPHRGAVGVRPDAAEAPGRPGGRAPSTPGSSSSRSAAASPASSAGCGGPRRVP